MRNPTIWERFVESSKHMEDMLTLFDNEYNWGSEQDEPQRPRRTSNQGPAGLRDLCKC